MNNLQSKSAIEQQLNEMDPESDETMQLKNLRSDLWEQPGIAEEILKMRESITISSTKWEKVNIGDCEKGMSKVYPILKKVRFAGKDLYTMMEVLQKIKGQPWFAKKQNEIVWWANYEEFIRASSAITLENISQITGIKFDAAR